MDSNNRAELKSYNQCLRLIKHLGNQFLKKIDSSRTDLTESSFIDNISYYSYNEIVWDLKKKIDCSLEITIIGFFLANMFMFLIEKEL